MPTANDLITTSARKLGAIADGEVLPASRAANCLAVLNSMLDAWAIKRLLVYQIVQASFTWPANTVSRTIGVGGNFNTSWPSKIEEGTFFRDSSNQDFPVVVTTDRTEYDRICVKSVTSTYPELLFYDRAFPLGTIYVYPKTSTSALTLFLNSWKTLQSFTVLTDNLSLPPGYQRLIEFNLAVELESEFPLQVPASVLRIANESMTDIKHINAPSILSDLDPALLSKGKRANIRADE